MGPFGGPGIGPGMGSVKLGMGVRLMGTGAETRPSGIVEWGKSSDPVSLQYKPQMSAPVPSNNMAVTQYGPQMSVSVVSSGTAAPPNIYCQYLQYQA